MAREHRGAVGDGGEHGADHAGAVLAGHEHGRPARQTSWPRLMPAKLTERESVPVPVGAAAWPLPANEENSMPKTTSTSARATRAMTLERTDAELDPLGADDGALG